VTVSVPVPERDSFFSRQGNKLSVPLKMTQVDGASNGAAHIGGHYTKVLADANSVACLREREH